MKNLPSASLYSELIISFLSQQSHPLEAQGKQRLSTLEVNYTGFEDAVMSTKVRPS